MKPKQFVTVYEKPYTHEKPEGKAMLLRQVPEDESPYMEQGMEFWEVTFVDDGVDTFRRLVHPDDIIQLG